MIIVLVAFPTVMGIGVTVMIILLVAFFHCFTGAQFGMDSDGFFALENVPR
jgi:hypothetical protein